MKKSDTYSVKEKDIQKEMSKRIKAQRQKVGMTTSEMARRVGVPNVTAWAWQNGARTPQALKIAKLCEILDIDANYILMLDRESISSLSKEEQFVIDAYRKNKKIKPIINQICSTFSEK